MCRASRPASTNSTACWAAAWWRAGGADRRRPGIGKSTLLLQALANLSASRRVLYVSGEESAAQIALRAQRLGVEAATLGLLPEISWRRSRPRSRPTSPKWP
jgi:hypothetical protein